MFLFLSGGIGLVWFASPCPRIIWAICQHSPLDTANTGQHSHNLKPSGRSNLGKHWKKENIWEFSQNVRQFFFVSWVFMGDLRELFLRFLVLGIGKTSPPHVGKNSQIITYFFVVECFSYSHLLNHQFFIENMRTHMICEDFWQNLAIFAWSKLMKSNIQIARCLNSQGRVKIWIVDLSNALDGEFLDFLCSDWNQNLELNKSLEANDELHFWPIFSKVNISS